MTEKPVRVRFAPSPTGHMHLGSARTALYNYLLARKTGGQFILRIEDTDQKRLVPGAEQELIDGLKWLGLQYDEGPDIGGPFGPYRQTDRFEIYQGYARQLVEMGKAFPCFCTAERLEKVRNEQQKNKINTHYDGTCRDLEPDEAARRIASGEKHVIRFRMPQDGTTTAHDLLRGDITIENRLLDDTVLVKSDGWPTYHLAAMVDDQLMGITHVFRSSEWLGTFPLHVNIVRAFGWQEPVWIHLSVFLKPSGKGKMSKRESADAMKDGYSFFIKDLPELGFTREGALNWIALMGWGAGETEDILSLDRMIEIFDINRLTASPAAINYTKLDYFNGEHIRRLPVADLAARIKPYLLNAGLQVDDDRLLRIVPLIRERLVTLDDCLPFAAWFFRESVTPNPLELVAKGLSAAQSAEVARRCYAVLESLPELSHALVEPPMRELLEELALAPNQVFGILRVAVTGQMVSPPLFESMEIVGREKVLERLRNAIEMLEKL